MSLRWEKYKLSDVCRTGSGGTPSRKENRYYEGGSISWVKSGELRNDEVWVTSEHITQAGVDNSSAKLLDPGCVLIAMYGATTGECAMLRIPAATNQAICHIQPREVLKPMFVFYYLKSQFQQLLRLQVGGAQPNISQSILRNLEIPVPHLKEQARIVELLDQADALRKLRRQADEKAARILPALFHHYFGDPQKLSQNSGITTGDLILETQYGTSQSASKAGLGVPVLRMNNIEYSGDLNLSDIKTVELSPEDRKRYDLKAGDLLFNRTNSAELVGKVGLWNDEIESAVPASYLIRFRVDTDQVLPEFTWAYMNSDYFKSLLKSKARKAIGMSNINAQELRSFPAFKPPMNAQVKFRDQLSILTGIRKSATASKQKLEDLFQLLLHRAFTGELTAKWREDHMNELVEEMEIQARA